MNRTLTLSLLSLIVISSIIISGYVSGPAAKEGLSLTGADKSSGNIVGCGDGCHNYLADSLILVSIELDSAGLPTQHFVPGGYYTVKLKGVNNNSTLTLPSFGFQINAIKGAIASITPVQAGTWSDTLPASTHYAAPLPSHYTIGLIEHSNAIPASSGNGGVGTTYIESFNWTAPTGMDTISIWAALNAVNGNGKKDIGDHWDTAHAVFTKWGNSAAGIFSIRNNSTLKTLCNPISNELSIELNSEVNPGNYKVEFYTTSGQCVFSSNLTVVSNSKIYTFNTNNLAIGTYIVKLSNNLQFYSARVVKL